MSKHAQQLRKALNEQAEVIHNEIDTIIKDIQSEIDDMDAQHLAAIDKQEKEINKSIDEITQDIIHLQNLFNSNDFCIVTVYTSRIEEFSYPLQLNVTLPTFISQEINKEQIHKHIGILAKLAVVFPTGELFENKAITTEEDGSFAKSTDDVVTPLIYEPLIISVIDTNFGRLNSVACFSDEEIWTLGNEKSIKLFNLQGELINSVRTKTGNKPVGIAVTKNKNLVYTDHKDKSNVLPRDSESGTCITLRDWKPCGVSSSPSGGLLVTMQNSKETKVVRYSGFEEKQSIHWDDEGQPLFLSACYICENRNLDVCG